MKTQESRVDLEGADEGGGYVVPEVYADAARAQAAHRARLHEAMKRLPLSVERVCYECGHREEPPLSRGERAALLAFRCAILAVACGLCLWGREATAWDYVRIVAAFFLVMIGYELAREERG